MNTCAQEANPGAELSIDQKIRIMALAVERIDYGDNAIRTYHEMVKAIISPVPTPEP